MEFIEKAEQEIVSRRLFPDSAAVVVAVSGGVDSMVLLEVLGRLAPGHHWTLRVAHFNHQLRGAASDEDELFVRRECERRALPFQSDRGDVRAYGAAEGISLEMAARELRYRFLARVAQEAGAPVIALAHHADDQAETFWLRLLRGDVGPGVAGMRWKRSLAPGVAVALVRPFLNLPKAEIHEFAGREGVRYREDASNQETHFQRNRLRHDVLPFLEKYQPELRRITARAAEVLRSEKDFLQSMAGAWLKQNDRSFNSAHPALQREIVRQQLLAAAIQPDFELIERLQKSAEVPVSVSSDAQVWRDAAGTIHVRASEPQDFALARQTVSIATAGQAEFGSLLLSWEVLDARGASGDGTEWFDAEAIGPEVTLRHWQAGDRYQPIGSEHAVKLQDAFTNQKVRLVDRRRRVIAIATNGEIFWVEGLRIAERCKVRPSTNRVLRWSWKQKASSSTMTYATNQT